MKVRAINARQAFNAIRVMTGVNVPYIPPGEQGRLFFEKGDLPEPVQVTKVQPPKHRSSPSKKRDMTPWWLKD
jgi:hypothetical protein